MIADELAGWRLERRYAACGSSSAQRGISMGVSLFLLRFFSHSEERKRLEREGKRGITGAARTWNLEWYLQNST